MLIVGLTGGIASGKSVVARAWMHQPGVLVIDTDQVVHSLYRPGTPIYHRLVEAFGEGIIDSQGQLDRRALSRLVFGDERARRRLNAIVHPAVRERLRELAERARAKGTEILVIEAALLLESDPVERSFYDCYVLVTVDAPSQLERLMARDGLSREQALARIESQSSQAEKIGRADYLISTSGRVEDTAKRAKELLAKLRARGSEFAF